MGAAGNAIELDAGGRTVRLSSPDKVYFPERGLTKRHVAEYYLAVAPGITRALRDRPTTLERFPDGVEGESFFQKRAPKNLPDWIPTAHIAFPSGRTADEICPTEPAAVLWAANLGCLTFHPWPVRRKDTDRPDELRIDLDPQPGTDYHHAVAAAHELRALLEELGLRGWPKTSGGRGLHVFVPIEPRWTFTEVRRCAIALGRELERRMPGKVTTAWWKEERGERIFVDYNQTARDRTIASAYSVRPRPHAPVSAPLRWDEVDDAEPRDFDIVTMLARFAELGDLHADMDEHAFALDAVLELAARDEHEHGLGDMPYPRTTRRCRASPSASSPAGRSTRTDRRGLASEGRRALPGGVPPGEGGEVGLHPAVLRSRGGQRGGAVVVREQALVEQRGMAVGEGGVVVAGLGRVVPDQLHPGTADGRVVLLRRTRVAGGPPDAVADQGDRRGYAAAAHGQPGQVDVLPVAEPFGGRHHFGHQRVKGGLGHQVTSVMARSAARSPATASADRSPSARRSRSVMDCRILVAASCPESVSSTSTARRSPGRVPRVM